MSIGNTIHTELLKLLEKQLNVILAITISWWQVGKWINSISVKSVIPTNIATISNTIVSMICVAQSVVISCSLTHVFIILRWRIILCYTVQILIDRSNAIYRLCLHYIHTKAPNHPIYQTNFCLFSTIDKCNHNKYCTTISQHYVILHNHIQNLYKETSISTLGLIQDSAPRRQLLESTLGKYKHWIGYHFWNTLYFLIVIWQLRE